MGALLSSLFLPSQPPDKHRKINRINFEDVKPSEEEKELYETLRKEFEEARVKMSTIVDYDGCSREVQEAIANPNSDIEIKAWEAIVPQVKQLDTYYNSSLEVVRVFEEIIKKLCDGDVNENINSMNAITKLFADTMCLAYEFDQVKVSKSQIQNDFSYYKRVLSRMKASPLADSLFLVSDAKANKVSLFFAQFCPMTNSIAESCTKLIAKDKTGTLRTHIVELLPKISFMCSNVVTSDTAEELCVYCLKVLANVIVLYDYADPAGAFVRTSKLKVGSLIKLIQLHESPETRSIFDFITRASPNFNAPTTPKNIKALIKPERVANTRDHAVIDVHGPF